MYRCASRRATRNADPPPSLRCSLLADRILSRFPDRFLDVPVFLHAGECKLLDDRCKFHKLANRYVDVHVRARRLVHDAGIRAQLHSLQAYRVVFHECLQQNLMARYDIREKYEHDENDFHWFVRLVAEFFTHYISLTINLSRIHLLALQEGVVFRVKLYFAHIHTQVSYIDQRMISPKV